MKKKNRSNTNFQLKLNLIYNIFYQLLTLLVPLLTAPYISRILGVKGVGLYSYTYSIAQYFVLFMMLGVLNYGNREIAKVKDNRTELSDKFCGIYSVQFYFGLVVIILYLLFAIFFSKYQVLMFVQGLYVLSGIFDISWFYFGIENFKFTTGISTINKILTTILIFTIVRNQYDIALYTIIISGGTLLNNLAYWCNLKKYIDFEKLKPSNLKVYGKPLFILFIPVIAISIYKYMDKIMLGSMLSADEVGIYEAAEKFINLPVCFVAAFGTVMLPRITNMKKNNQTDYVRKYNFISMVLVVFLSIGMSFGLAGITEVFIPWFYGIDFNQSINVLFVLLPSIIFVSWANVIRTQCLLPNQKDKQYCISVSLGAIINLIINLIFIPKYGAVGAAIGTLIAEGSVCIMQTIMCREFMDITIYLKYCICFMIVGGIMFLIIKDIYMTDDFMTILVRIIIGGITYSFISFLILKKAFNMYRRI